MLRKLALLTALFMMSAFAGGLARPAAAAPAAGPLAQASPQTFTVLVGGQSTPHQKEPDEMPAGDWQFMRFYPENITVNVGDTIVWKINSAEFHNVLFPAPGQAFVPFTLVEGGTSGPPTVSVNPLAGFPQGGPTYDGSATAGSGILSMGPGQTQEYRLTFTKEGTFNYYCSIHSAQLPSGQIVGMLGSVSVQGAGAAYPKSQAQIDSDAQAKMAEDMQAASALEPQAKQVAAPTANGDGTMTYHGNVGFDSGNYSYMRFAPEDFTIHVGDSIEWTQTSTETPHTVSLTSGAADPELIVQQPQPAGPPKLLLNPLILVPAGGTTYDGSGFLNSGFMPGKNDPSPGPRSYKLTFTKAGTYEYICILHDDMGMSGNITVLAGGQPGMPTTGQADYTLLAWLLLGVLLVSNGLFLARRRAQA